MTDLRKTTQISNFMKILPVGDELFHADGRADGQTQTDLLKLIVDICNFTITPKNWRLQCFFFKSIYIISSKNVIVVVSEEYVVYFYINACLYVNPNGCAQSPFNNSYSVFLIIVNTIGQLSLLLGLSPNLLICPPLWIFRHYVLWHRNL